MGRLPEPQWTIDGVMESGSLTIGCGDTNCGKTFLVLYTLAVLALGQPWFGRKTWEVRSAYVAGEGGGGIFARLQAFQRRYGAELGDGLIVITNPINLMDRDSVLELAKAIEAQQPDCALVVLDTLMQNFDGDDNKAADVSKALKHARLLCAQP